MIAGTVGYGGAIALVAGLTGASALWVLGDMPAHPHLAALNGAQQHDDTGRTTGLTRAGP